MPTQTQGDLSNTLLDHSPQLKCPSHTLTQRSPHSNTATSLPPLSTQMDDKNEGFIAEFEAPLLNQVLIYEDLPPLLSTVLPPSYTYQFLEFSWTPSCTKEEFHSRILINVSDEDRAIEWLQAFENHNSTTYRVTRGSKFSGKRILYKTERHCQHKRKKAKNSKTNEHLKLRDKKTDCPSKLTLKLHSSKNCVIKSHPCELVLHWGHNHTINSAKALSFRPISKNTKEKFESYFDQGHSPSSALHYHQLNLVVMHEGNEQELERCRADRSTNPMYKDVYYLFKKWRLKHHGKENGKEMLQKLEEIINDYNKNQGDEGGRAFLQCYEKGLSDKSESWDNRDTDKPLVLAICTPLMARAHEMVRQASEMVFCDSTAIVLTDTTVLLSL